MAKCTECENALIGRSRIVKPISSMQRMVSDWVIEKIDCRRNRKTSIYSEIDCTDYRRANDGRE